MERVPVIKKNGEKKNDNEGGRSGESGQAYCGCGVSSVFNLRDTGSDVGGYFGVVFGKGTGRCRKQCHDAAAGAAVR